MRGAIFLAAFLLFWISADPFPDLRSEAAINGQTAGNLLNQIVLIALAAGSVAFMLTTRLYHQLKAHVTPALVLLLAWLAISVATSASADLSFRRLVQTLCVLVVVAAALHLPRTLDHFNKLLLIGAAAVLAIAYFGVMFIPDLSIHSAADLIQPETAGSWRGHFAHKNRAGGAMVLLFFVGHYLAAAYDRKLGIAICVSAFIFLIFTRSSTALGLLFVVYALSFVLARMNSAWLRTALVVCVLGTMALLTIGTRLFEPMRSLVEAIASDPTYTNRTDIWEYGLSQLWLRPILGFGYDAFWGPGGVGFSDEFKSVWAMSAPTGHNSYLDVALSTGVPGLVLFLLWVLIQPLQDFHNGLAGGQDRRLLMLFLRAWLFGILYGCLESSLLFGKDPMWFMFLLAIFGMRLLAVPYLKIAVPSTQAASAPGSDSHRLQPGSAPHTA